VIGSDIQIAVIHTIAGTRYLCIVEPYEPPRISNLDAFAFSGLMAYAPRLVQCYWPLDEITPHLAPQRDTSKRLMATARRAPVHIVRPLRQPCWSGRRFRSRTWKSHTNRKRNR
jgi:hypothetical protein